MADLVFGSIAFDCTEFTNCGAQRAKRVVVSPIRVLCKPEVEDRDEYVIFQGCNMYQACRNPNCVYSITSRDQARERRKARQT